MCRTQSYLHVVPPAYTLAVMCPRRVSKSASARELDAGLLTRWKCGRITKNESKFYLVIMSRSVTTFRHTALSHTVSVREPDVSTLNRRVVRLSSSRPPDLSHAGLWIWGLGRLSAARPEKVRIGRTQGVGHVHLCSLLLQCFYTYWLNSKIGAAFA